MSDTHLGSLGLVSARTEQALNTCLLGGIN